MERGGEMFDYRSDEGVRLEGTSKSMSS